MKKLYCSLVVTLLFAAGCSTKTEARTDSPRNAKAQEADEVAIALADVPANVLETAKKAVPGLVVTGAEREVEKGVVIYEIVGTADGEAYEVEVTADGKVGEIEKGGEDDDDGANDDGEDDDD